MNIWNGYDARAQPAPIWLRNESCRDDERLEEEAEPHLAGVRCLEAMFTPSSQSDDAGGTEVPLQAQSGVFRTR